MLYYLIYIKLKKENFDYFFYPIQIFLGLLAFGALSNLRVFEVKYIALGVLVFLIRVSFYFILSSRGKINISLEVKLRDYFSVRKKIPELTPRKILFQILFLIFITPFLEELFFRVLLWNFLFAKTSSPFWCWILQAFLFALYHFLIYCTSLRYFIKKMIAGIIYGLPILLGGNVWVSIIAHILFNFFVQMIYPTEAEHIRTMIRKIVGLPPREWREYS